MDELTAETLRVRRRITRLKRELAGLYATRRAMMWRQYNEGLLTHRDIAKRWGIEQPLVTVQIRVEDATRSAG
jgi:hypothetical protein